MIIARKGIDRDCDCKKNFIQRIEELITRAWNCVNKINNITPDGDNNFTIVGSEKISVEPEGNGLKISLNDSSGVDTINGKSGNIVIQSNDNNINVTDNGNNTIGLQLKPSIVSDIDNLKDDVLLLQNEDKVKSLNQVSPDANGDIEVLGDNGVYVGNNPSNLTIGLDTNIRNQISKIPTIESNLTTVAGQTETNRQNIVTLQNETIIKKINNVNPDSSGNFTISAGSNISLTPTTNGLEISSSGGGGGSSDWTRYTDGTNWVTGGLFNSSRTALSDVLFVINATTSVTNLYLSGEYFIPKNQGFDLIGRMVLRPFGTWFNDKIIHSITIASGTTDIASSLTGSTMKVNIQYRVINENYGIESLQTVNITMNKNTSSVLILYK